MKAIALRSNIGRDGYLRLRVPTAYPNRQVDIILLVNASALERPEKKGYDFSDLAGCLKWRGNSVRAQRKIRNEW